jgi:3-oxoacyl-[acyl-carrier protein] reductase
LQKFNSQIKDNGRIIFIGSILGNIPHAISIPYGVSKASVNMLCKSLVKVFKSRQITVNVVSPGFVDTDWQKVKPKEYKQRIKDKIALNRFADLNEISSTIIHTIENGYINGAIIDVNGGYGME